MKNLRNRLSLAPLLTLASLLLPPDAAALPLVEETLTLKAGWNAVYIESTPENPSCDAFFADMPEVLSAAAYRSDADAETAQYDLSGAEKVQAPVQYLQWSRDSGTVATLKTLVGGGAYVIYATAAAQKTFRGRPVAPTMTWRRVSSAETNEFFNLVGVSSVGGKITFQDYFGEGPFGMSKSGRMICTVGGDDINGPEMKSVSGSFGKEATLVSGMAYALTATESGSWPGVIGVQGGGLFFDGGANYASIRIQNCGTTNHTFSLRLVQSADQGKMPTLARRLPRVDAITPPGFTNVTADAWTVELAPDEVSEQIFSLDRSALAPGEELGAVLEIEDLGASRMRVRLPVSARGDAADAVAFPTGLWTGEISLSLVSGLTDGMPVPAGGSLKMNVMMHVDENRRCTLLQRAAFGFETNGTARLFKELARAEAAGIANAKRFSTVMMSVDTPAVAAAENSLFGDDAVFTWVVDPKARDNPFRHAWHPDHDGKTADYSGDLQPGDDPGLYANPVKPELWSITNRMEFTWHEGGSGANPVNFGQNPSETTTGIVFWDVDGLIAQRPIRTVGTFALKRVFKAKELEE